MANGGTIFSDAYTVATINHLSRINVENTPTNLRAIGDGVSDSLFADFNGMKIVLKRNAGMRHNELSRELAAFTLSRALPGLVNIPPQVKVTTRTFGGHVETFVAMPRIEKRRDASMRGVLRSDIVGGYLFDILVNQWDRPEGKTSNHLITPGNRLVLIDHALCFDTGTRGIAYSEIGQAANLYGHRLPGYAISFLETRLLRKRDAINDTLRAIGLESDERMAMFARAEQLLATGRYPTRRSLFGGR